jgi:septal ring factor EnvC (AmiA/AmiB activator)
MIILILALLLTGVGRMSGQKVKELESQRRAVLEEIELTSQLLKEIRSSANISLNRLNLLSAQVQSRQKAINLLNEEIAVIDKDMAAQRDELTVLDNELQNIRKKYAASVNDMYTRHSGQYKWLFVLSTNNFAQMIRRMRYIREYTDWQKQQGELILKKQEDINLIQSQLERTRAEKETLMATRQEENNTLRREESSQKEELQQLNKKRTALQTELNRQRTQAANINSQIEKFITNETASSNKATGAPRKAETTGGYKMTNEEQKLSGDFASNRGKLPFPISGRYRIVRPFGEYQHPQLKNVRLKSSGIIFQTAAGAEAQAVFGGVVSRVFTVPGSNSYGVLIRHGNYVTAYINLGEVYIKNGDKVSVSQKIGKIYTDKKNGNTTILHFEIRKERDALNPELWLR